MTNQSFEILSDLDVYSELKKNLKRKDVCAVITKSDLLDKFCNWDIDRIANTKKWIKWLINELEDYPQIKQLFNSVNKIFATSVEIEKGMRTKLHPVGFDDVVKWITGGGRLI